MNCKNIIGKAILFLVVSIIGIYAFSSGASAGQFYPNGYGTCVNVGNGAYKKIWSVANYACVKAIEKNQNACATWLGPTNSSTTTEITASGKSGSITIRYWGMCTDRADTSTTIQVTMDNNAIGDGNAYNFTRSGTWGVPSYKDTTLDIEKFIKGATRLIRNGKETYYRMVLVDRCHSDGGSCGVDLSDIYLVVGDSTEPDTPESEDSICNTWGSPDSYLKSNSLIGTTSIDVRVKNTDPRFGGVGNGAWSTNFVYAKPGDAIAWHTCYYPGVQYTARTPVSQVGDSHVWKGFEDLKDNICMVNPVPVIKQELNLAMTRTPKNGAGGVWQNKYNLLNNMSDGHSITGSLGIQPGSGNFGVGNTEVRWSHNEGDTVNTDGGKSYTEYGETGSPKGVSITTYNAGSKKIYGEKGSCYINDNGTNKIKIDGTTYPVCPTTGVTFTDSDPRKGLVAANPSAGTAAYNCWKAITGYATDCNACNGDADCSKNCNTCGGSSCTCEDVDNSYRCLQCENRYAEDIVKATVNEDTAKSDASVIIPYNFANYTGVSIKSDPVYAGEIVEINEAWVRVAPRWNSQTIASYATKVPQVNVKFIAYVTKSSSGGTSGDKVSGNGEEDLCSIINDRIAVQEEKPKQCVELASEKVNDLNSEGNLDGTMFRFGGGEYNAFDASAGDSYCVVSAVWPAESLDTEYEGHYNGGDRNWRLSEPDCRVIAKKPSFQVWGAGMYSNGGITVDIEKKNSVFVNYYNNNWKLGSNFKTIGGSATYFGSWVDQGLVIGNGLTTTVASGAALGNTNTKIQTGNSGNICSWSPLTFANSSCGTLGVGKSGIGSGVSSNREELIDYWLGTNGGTANVGNGETVNLSGNVGTEINTSTGVKVRYIKSNGGLTISGGSVGGSTTYLVKADGTLTINGNIRYDGSYKSLANIPKVVIYANNVNINCSVTEVDAVIVTKSGGKVNTCSDAGDIDAENRSKQLKIFGTVITDSVTLGRTYGNAAWSGSGDNGQKEAAEIFDYDSSILMWSEYMAGAAETDTLQTVYQHELAPRY